MPVALTNQASTTLSGGITALATSLSLATTTGANFPATSGSQWFYLTLTDKLQNWTKYEIVKVTTRTGDTCSVIVRAQDGTTAQTWASGDFAQLRLTKGTFADLTVQYANNADNLSNLASAATARTNLGLGSIATQAASAVAITGGTVAGVTLTGSAFNGTVGATTPSSVAATTIDASGQITSTLAIGTAPLVITSTTVVGNLNVSQLLGFTWNAPGAIGSVTPSTGAFSTLSASSTVSGAGFAAYLASPPAIGGGVAAAGTFAALNATTIRATTYINYRGGDNVSATNSGFGESALDSNAGGTNNTAVGNNALTANTTGNANTAVGRNALAANTTGSNNVALGNSSMGANTTGGVNVGLGLSVLAANTSGFSNVALGDSALTTNISGGDNIAVGSNALYLLGPLVNAGSFIVGVSYTIQFSGTTVFTAVGAANNNVGTIFTATGVGAGTGTASANTSYDVAIGYQAGANIDTGKFNTAYGYFAGYTITSGSSNTCIGAGADAAAASANSTAIGNGATSTIDNQVVFGNASIVQYLFPGTAAYLKYAGSYSSKAPVTETAATHTVAIATSSLICNRAGTITVTLPAAATYPGRELRIKTITANTVVSNAANVVPLAGGAAGTAICAGVAGSFALLHSNGATWDIMMGV